MGNQVMRLADRLAMIGVAAVGIGNMVLKPQQNPIEIQQQVIMDMNDIITLEKEVEDRKKRNEKELRFKNYIIIIK